MTTNDNDATTGGVPIQLPDGHGMAALLLVESLIHGLCADETLSVRSSVEIAERAVSVQLDQAEAADGSAAAMWRSHRLLSAIAASLSIDDRSPPMPPRLVV